ncbi:MAG: hypothetical protein NTV22_03985, partial [bacterium]|nr:hypothetical protein [bacterium]
MHDPAPLPSYRETYVPAQAVCVDEQRLRACIAANDLAGALNVFSNLPPAYVHSGTLSRLAECFARVGQTNAAFAALWRAYGMRCALASALGGDAIQYPVLETAQLEEWYPAAACEDAAHYLAWFAKQVHQCAQLQKPEHLDAMRISPLYHVAQQYTANTNLV